MTLSQNMKLLLRFSFGEFEELGLAAVAVAAGAMACEPNRNPSVVLLELLTPMLLTGRPELSL